MSQVSKPAREPLANFIKVRLEVSIPWLRQDTSRAPEKWKWQTWAWLLVLVAKRALLLKTDAMPLNT